MLVVNQSTSFNFNKRALTAERQHASEIQQCHVDWFYVLAQGFSSCCF